ncbi:MAG TPA: class I adenylate-forming enzyme family protein [Candidatus Limnocylindrales bacterium]|nr:class I adenylate-forming enzyme family protein [Candidatus Limnocylindrales bacterium]
MTSPRPIDTADERAAPLLTPPTVTFQGRRFDAEALADMAAAWHGDVAGRLSPAPDAVAVVTPSHPETIALVFALSALAVPVVLLHPEPATWRSAPPFPRNMPVFLTPAAAHFQSALAATGLSATVLPPPSRPAGPRPPFFSAPGFVIFTSGSTGAPKPTFRSTTGLLRLVGTITRTYSLRAGVKVAGCLPLATSFGLTQNMILPAFLRGHLSLLERFDHRSLLNLFAADAFDYWPGTALMADLLVRAPLGDWAGRGPAICNLSSGHLPVSVYHRFLERFGVPIRQSYGRSECSFITSETAPVDTIRPETVGFPSPGVEIRCGDSPDTPTATGDPGRIWINCPWHSEGYGFPPHLEPMARPDGWCPTEDVGMLSADGRLTILGRIDDCFKTTGGFLVSPALVAGALRGHPDVVDAAVVPVPGRSGALIGIVAATRGTVNAAQVHELARQALPSWLRPAIVVTRPEIPALVTGKHDRAACIHLLKDAMSSHDGQPRS